MKNNNAQIYGPPTHTPTEFSIRVRQTKEGWQFVTINAYSETSLGPVWSIHDYTEIPDDGHVHLNMGAEAYGIVSDLVQSQPNTEERARFILSGGLEGWCQEELF